MGAGSGDYEAGRREAPAGGLNIRREYTVPRAVAIDIMTSQGMYSIVVGGSWKRVLYSTKQYRSNNTIGACNAGNILYGTVGGRGDWGPKPLSTQMGTIVLLYLLILPGVGDCADATRGLRSTPASQTLKWGMVYGTGNKWAV